MSFARTFFPVLLLSTALYTAGAVTSPLWAAEPPPSTQKITVIVPAQFNKRGFTPDTVAKLYEAHDNALFWHDDTGSLTTRGKVIIDQLKTSWQDGLVPEKYGAKQLETYSDTGDGFSSAMQADTFLSAAFLHYLSDIRFGRARGDENDPENFIIEPYHDSQKALLASIENSSIPEFIDTLRPQSPTYTAIRGALLNQGSDTVKELAQRIQNIKPDGLLIHKGEKNALIPVIRDFLATEGFDVPTNFSAPTAEETDDITPASTPEEKQPSPPDDFANLNDDMLIVVKTDEQADGDISYEMTQIPDTTVQEELKELPQILPSDPELYDSQTERAFRSYQNQYGLLVDGVIGPQSIRHMQKSFENRTRKLAMTLERLRWYNEVDISGKHILVNIPGFYTQTYDENGDTVFFMDVIIGTGERRTPEMISVIPSITFAPYWMVPSKIARENVLPKIQEDPNYYADMGFELFEHVRGERVLIDASQFDWASIPANQFPPFRFRQRPGPQNSLGPVRLNIINKHDIFLHGTSHPELFSLTNRNLSSGCVRLKDPWQMVQFIANKSSSFTENKLLIFYNKAVEGVEGFASYTIALDKKVPVHIVYWTSWVDEQNIVHYANDIYNRDKTLERMVETQG